jgi:hypothetical protein
MLEPIARRVAGGLALTVALAGCVGSAGASAPSEEASPTATVSATTSAAGSGTTFTSAMYGYSIDVPSGWYATAATKQWDGTKSPGNDDPVNDRFVTGVSASAWVRAAPVTLNLADYVAATIAGNAQFHGDTCGREPPDSVEAITIGGEPGSLLAWDCGILINVGVTVHGGSGFFFGLRDPSVKAATDPVDHDLFVAMLASVRFAG